MLSVIQKETTANQGIVSWCPSWAMADYKLKNFSGKNHKCNWWYLDFFWDIFSLNLMGHSSVYGTVWSRLLQILIWSTSVQADFMLECSFEITADRDFTVPRWNCGIKFNPGVIFFNTLHFGSHQERVNNYEVKSQLKKWFSGMNVPTSYPGIGSFLAKEHTDFKVTSAHTDSRK